MLGALVIIAAGAGFYLRMSDSALLNGLTLNTNIGTNESSNSAGWKRKTDAANLYSVEIPDDWKISSSDYVEADVATTPRPWNSVLIAQSPDWRTENRNDFDAPTHVALGAAIEFYVSNTPIDSGASNLGMPIKPTPTKREVSVDGIKGEFVVYREDDPLRHEEALVLEANMSRSGNFYVFRFAYNPETLPNGEETFTKMLNSIEFKK